MGGLEISTAAACATDRDGSGPEPRRAIAVPDPQRVSQITRWREPAQRSYEVA